MELLTLEQIGMVDEFCNEFELMSCVMQNVLKEIIEDNFLGGWCKDIQAKVYDMAPVGI